MERIRDLGGQLAWFDRSVRFVAGAVLMVWPAAGGAPAWLVSTLAAVGGILIFEAVVNHCPLAKALPWNR